MCLSLLHFHPCAGSEPYCNCCLSNKYTYMQLRSPEVTRVNFHLTAPTYLNVTPRMLRSSSERRLALPSAQLRQSRLFSFVVPRWWNELPSTTRAFFSFLCKIVFIVTLGLYCS